MRIMWKRTTKRGVWHKPCYNALLKTRRISSLGKQLKMLIYKVNSAFQLFTRLELLGFEKCT